MDLPEKNGLIGILYICTGKYTVFWKDFYLSATKYLFPETKKKFFVFTDLSLLYGEENNPNIVRIPIENREWPYNTLLRFEMFDSQQKQYAGCDYLLFYNANTVFVEKIQPEELLPEAHENYLVALSTENHLLNCNIDEYTYDRNPASKAYIPYGKGKAYYRGGFNGGRTPEFLTLIRTCKDWVNADLQSNVMALWHDESHLNKYLLDKSIKIVTTFYGKPEEWKRPNQAKVIFIDKRTIFGIRGLNKFKGQKKSYSLKYFWSKIAKKFSKTWK